VSSRLTIIAAGAVLLVAGGSAQAGTRNAQHCARSGARDVAADARGRIYELRSHGLAPWYACLRSRDRSLFIDESSPPESVLSLPAVASPFAAVVIDKLSTNGPVSEVNLIDMRSGGNPTALAPGGVSDLVLTKHGVVAWIQAGDPGVPRSVRRMDRHGDVAQLDSGDIAAGSLAVNPDGRHLYWTREGVARTAAA
jgi:hypothetical protein